MVMDQFVTTYRKDYLWPYIKTLGVRPHPEINQYNRENAVPCECHNIARRENNQHGHEQDILGPLAYQEESWSRLGPMGPLLDPKIYPAKVSSAPESHVSRFNQPNVFLQKLQEKYPFIYECLRTAPPDDLLARINKDRLSSTYQVDYCRKREYPSAPYDELLRAAGVEGSASCPEPIALPGDTCKIYRNSRVTDSGASRGGSHPCGGIHKAKEAAYCVGNCKGHFSSITPGATEYQDAISRLGNLIIRDRLHDPSVQKSGYYSKPSTK
ncbi:uncharacterized protein LOC143191875 isoform X1 [Rhynchophorus ferrugineus]|uniref:uncharacterized protein LOC143191875 isoform X1 n=1 Tax=Rhynchophorus ferrugineus TaxID=354439 RepID=UPI003FCCBFBF